MRGEIIGEPHETKSTLYTDKRLQELADSKWLFHFLQQFPRVKQLRAGVEDALLEGAIDMHVHADPCSLMPRNQDFTTVALQAAGARMRAVVRKDHYHSTVGEAYAIQRHIDDLVERGELAHRVEVYGGVPVAGSLDTAAMAQVLRFEQFRMIWLNPVGGERLVNGGSVLPETARLIAFAAEHGKGLNVGAPSHSAKKNAGIGDYEGLAPVVEEIRKRGGKAVLDHPLSSMTIDEIEPLTDEGVYVGLFCYPSLPSVIKAPVVDPARTLELVRRVGAEQCLVASDVGMLLEPTALEAMRMMVRLLLVLGLSDEEIRMMVRTNPTRLLGLGSGQPQSAAIAGQPA